MTLAWVQEVLDPSTRAHRLDYAGVFYASASR